MHALRAAQGINDGGGVARNSVFVVPRRARAAGDGSQDGFYSAPLYLTAYWKDKESGSSGRETLTLEISCMRGDLITPAQYVRSRSTRGSDTD